MFSPEKLEQLIQDRNMEEAKKMVGEYLSQELSPTERAEAYTTIAQIYLRTSNSLDEKYLENSEQMVDALEDLQTMESGLKDQIDLSETRKSLKE
jgi:hypothetical protein